MKNITLITLLFTSIIFSQNLLKNGSFENTTNSIPDNWALEEGDFSIENATILEGANSLKVIPSISPLGGLPTSLLSQSFTLSDTDEHTFSFKYYLEGSFLNNEIDQMSYEFKNITGSKAFFFTQGENVPTTDFIYNQWVTVTYTIKVLAFRNSATSTNIKFFLRSGAFSNTNVGTKIFYDDIKLDSNTNLGINNVNIQNTAVIDFIKDKNIYLKSNHNIDSYSIFSLSGSQLIKDSRVITNNIINTDFLSTGVYIIVLNDIKNKLSYSKKIIIN